MADWDYREWFDWSSVGVGGGAMWDSDSVCVHSLFFLEGVKSRLP